MKKEETTDSVLWQKPLYKQKCQQGKMTTQKHHQKRL